MEVGDVELLVGSVQVVVRQAESHHHAGNLEHVLKVSDDRNGAAGANEDRLFPKDVAQSLGSGLNVAIVGADDAGRALAPNLALGLDAISPQLLHLTSQ